MKKGKNVVIYPGTKFGKNVVVGDNAVIGKAPTKARRSVATLERTLPPAVIGDDVTIGAGVVLYRGCRIGNGVFVADLATVREDVVIGDETIVGRGVAVENECAVGRKCKIETEAYLCAKSTVEDFCFIAPRVCFTNDNFLGRTKERLKRRGGPVLRRGARIGANATILPGLEIGADALVAAGSVVTRSVPPRKVVMGVPARVVRDVPPEQLVEAQEEFR